LGFKKKKKKKRLTFGIWAREKNLQKGIDKGGKKVQNAFNGQAWGLTG